MWAVLHPARAGGIEQGAGGEPVVEIVRVQPERDDVTGGNRGNR
jgi:hypothetical protein